jgi:hypothetical protein
MVAGIIYIILMGIAGRLKGSDIGGKMAAFPLIMAATLGYVYLIDYDLREAGNIAMITLAGCALWLAPGIKRGFMMWHGLPITHSQAYNEKIGGMSYVPHTIALKLFRIQRRTKFNPANEGDYKAYGFWWMTFRGLYLLPLFIALAAYTHQPLVALYGLGGLSQGIAYWLGGKLCPIFLDKKGNKISYRVQAGEIIAGLIVGALIVGALA